MPAPAGPVPEAIRAIKESGLDITVWADVCMCEYTSHGHCGVLRGEIVDNDATLPLLARAAVAYADAGADVIAPSDMMDGRVTAIRSALDEGADMVMVKPAGPYLDVISAVRGAVDVPVVAYQVSGEFSMIEGAAANGWIDGDRVMMESLTSIARAGAGIILTYYATRAAQKLTAQEPKTQ